ncbi:MAG TPA: hypothetical protein VI670_17485 [Thermoanaerobaculia bacterium]
MKRLVIVVLVSLGAASAFAQSVGFIEAQAGGPMKLVPLSTGVPQTITVTNADACSCQAAYDPLSRDAFFVAFPGRIVAVNVQSGAVRSIAVTPPTTIAALVWDPFSGKLLGTPGSPSFQVVSIDPFTGAQQTLLTPSIADPEFRYLAFDAGGRRLFVFSSNSAGTQKLNVINLSNGTVNTLSIAAALDYAGMQYDPSTAKLIVLTAGAGGRQVVSMDPATGTRQSLVPVPVSTIAAVYGFTFEPFSRTAIITGWMGDGRRLAFANIVTGSITLSSAIGNDTNGLVAISPAEAAVPALGPIAMALLVLTLAILAVWRLR